jgi:hypothetical protein
MELTLSTKEKRFSLLYENAESGKKKKAQS